jgi:long-chain fatty acid transport protein
MKSIFNVRGYRGFRNFPRRLLCFALVALVFSGNVSGAGFALHENSVRSMGTAYAGAGANAGEEAATIFWNPAGMSRVEGSQFQIGGTYVGTTLEFENDGSSQSLLTSHGTVKTPGMGQTDDGGTDGFIPNLYAVTELNDRFKLGLGVFAPFGLSTEYDSGWIGRYHAVDSSIETICINPALSYRTTDRLTIGAGVSANYINAELTQAVFVLDPTTGRQLADGYAKIDGDSWAYGLNAGILYSFGDESRIGLAYRSNAGHTLDGNRTLSGVGAMSGRVGSRTDLILPESIVASGVKYLNDQWSIMGDVLWTRWSHLEALRIRFDDSTADSVTLYDWNDSWRFAFGAEYRKNAQWTFRGGVALDQSPIPNAQRRNPRLPGSDRRWITFGATYRPSEKVRVDFAYAYVKLDAASIDNTIDLTSGALPGAFTDTLIGSYDSDSHLAGIEISLAFGP